MANILPNDRMMTKKEIAYYLQVNIKTVDNMVTRGQLSAQKCGRSVRFFPNEVAKTLKPVQAKDQKRV